MVSDQQFASVVAEHAQLLRGGWQAAKVDSHKLSHQANPPVQILEKAQPDIHQYSVSDNDPKISSGGVMPRPSGVFSRSAILTMSLQMFGALFVLMFLARRVFP